MVCWSHIFQNKLFLKNQQNTIMIRTTCNYDNKRLFISIQTTKQPLVRYNREIKARKAIRVDFRPPHFDRNFLSDFLRYFQQ